MKKLAIPATLASILVTSLLTASSATNPGAKGTLRAMASGPAADAATFSRLAIVNPADTTVVEAGWSDSDLGGLLHARNLFGATVVAIGSDTFGEGVVTVQDINQNPRATVWVNGDGVGEFTVFNAGGQPAYSMVGNQGFVSWGGDIAEQFEGSTAELAPGTVVVLDPDQPGRVRASSTSYDRLVAGVVSGANDYHPGVRLGVTDDVNKNVSVTLTGTVYVRVSAVNGPIQVGDLLVTSDEPGYAMKATDFQATQGAVLGKAMEALPAEQGLVKMLVSLQ